MSGLHEQTSDPQEQTTEHPSDQTVDRFGPGGFGGFGDVVVPTFEGVFGLADHQRQLRQALRSYLDDRQPLRRVRELMAIREGYADDLWDGLCRLGLPGMFVPEHLGGAGLTLTDAVVALEETGRALLCSPHLGTLTAAAAVLGTGDVGACEQYLPQIAAGSLVATLAIGERSEWSPASTRTTGDAGGRVTGVKELVLDGGCAGLFLVSARETDGDVAFYAVAADAPGVTVRALAALDETRRFADVSFDRAQGRRLGTGQQSGNVGWALAVAVVMLAAEQIGAAEHCLEMTVAYAKDRSQFGRKIGSFQAVKHMCAEMLVEIEYSRGTAYYGAWAAGSDAAELQALTGVLKSAIGETFAMVAERTIQVHGGIGFTWEHDAHLFFKRATSDRMLFGSTDAHLDHMADVLGL